MGWGKNTIVANNFALEAIILSFKNLKMQTKLTVKTKVLTRTDRCHDLCCRFCPQKQLWFWSFSFLSISYLNYSNFTNVFAFFLYTIIVPNLHTSTRLSSLTLFPTLFFSFQKTWYFTAMEMTHYNNKLIKCVYGAIISQDFDRIMRECSSMEK